MKKLEKKWKKNENKNENGFFFSSFFRFLTNISNFGQVFHFFTEFSISPQNYPFCVKALHGLIFGSLIEMETNKIKGCWLTLNYSLQNYIFSSSSRMQWFIDNAFITKNIVKSNYICYINIYDILFKLTILYFFFFLDKYEMAFFVLLNHYGKRGTCYGLRKSK